MDEAKRRARTLEIKRKSREKHRDEYNRRNRERKKQNRTAITEYQRDYRRRKKLGLPLKGKSVPRGIDKVREKETKKKWLAAHVESERARHKEWRANNRERSNQTVYRYNKRHHGTGDAVDVAFRCRSALKRLAKASGKKGVKASGLHMGRVC